MVHMHAGNGPHALVLGKRYQYPPSPPGPLHTDQTLLLKSSEEIDRSS